MSASMNGSKKGRRAAVLSVSIAIFGRRRHLDRHFVVPVRVLVRSTYYSAPYNQ